MTKKHISHYNYALLLKLIFFPSVSLCRGQSDIPFVSAACDLGVTLNGKKKKVSTAFTTSLVQLLHTSASRFISARVLGSSVFPGWAGGP